jgi:hypothetical protein
VRGRVVCDDPAQPDPGQRFLVGLAPANSDLSSGAPNVYTAANDESHAFTIDGLKGAISPCCRVAHATKVSFAPCSTRTQDPARSGGRCD